MSIRDRILQAKRDFYREHNKLPSAIYIGRDEMQEACRDPREWQFSAAAPTTIEGIPFFVVNAESHFGLGI